jgi:hypothetical protein
MSDDSENIVLRLKWRKTWEDREDDFVAQAPSYNGSVGRIYFVPEHHGPKVESWYWAFQAFGDDISRNIGNLHGHADTARLAAQAVENAWFLAIAGTRHEIPILESEPIQPPKNAYAAAKGR